MAPGTRLGRETRRTNFEPASSAGSHDTISDDSDSFIAPPKPKDLTIESVLSDITNPDAESFSYIPPPAIRPAAPTPGFSSFLPSSRAPSSCDFGTPRAFSYSPPSVYQPSPPLMSRTRERDSDRAPYQAHCESASPSDDSLSRFFKGYSTSSNSARPRMEPPADEFSARTASSHSSAFDTFPLDLPAKDLPAPTVRHPHVYTSIASPRVDALTNNAPKGGKSRAEDTVDAFTSWSLFAINSDHLGDFVSGALKFGELDQEGKPVFVKQTKSWREFDAHKEVDAVHISQEEDGIIVSLDQLRKEIAELQEHDEAMEREADKLHKEKAKLELQLQEARGAFRKSSADSAIGSESDSGIRERVQADSKFDSSLQQYTG